MELFETCFLTSVVKYHKCVTLGGSTEHFTAVGVFSSAFYTKYSMQVTVHFGNSGIHAVIIRMLG